MRSRFAAPLLLLAALAAVPAAAQVEGRYQVVGINGHALPAASPTEDGVTVVRAAFWFEPDGRATVSMTANVASGLSMRRANGTYVTVRDSLRVTTGRGEPTATAYRWALDGDTLRLYDEHQNVYALLRQAAIAGEPWAPCSWNAVQVNGQDLPAPWPLSPEVTVTSMTFTFSADGQATVRIVATQDGEESDETATAPYRVEGDRLTVLDDHGNVDEAFAWTLREGTLRLVDQYGNVYELARP